MSGRDCDTKSSSWSAAPITTAISHKMPTDSIDFTGIDWDLEASTNPAQLPDITRMELNTGSTASLLSGGVLSPGRKTMKDYEQQQKNLEEENFQLKLRIYMLEERLQVKGTPDNDSGIIVDLKVQLATVREELGQKKELLRRASDTMESLEQQYGIEVEHQQRQFETERAQMEGRISALQTALERANLERVALSERSVAEQPYLKAFEPLAVDHAACHSQDELSALEDRMAELQAALGQMKQTVEQREQEGELLRRQLDEARSAAAQLAKQDERCHQLTDQLRQLQTDRDGRATEADQLTEQLRQLQTERDRCAVEADQLRHNLEQAGREPALEQLQRTCDQLTSGRAADGTRLAEMELALETATERLKTAAANEATLSVALQSVGTQLVERKAELAAARKAQRRSAAHIQTLIGEQRHLQRTVAQYLGSGAELPAPASDASPPGWPSLCGAGAAPSPPPTPHEVQVYLLRTETQRKDRKIRSMVAEMKQMNDVLVKYRWEVKELAEEENERLWTELEENKKLIREVQDEKMELVLEKERQIQRLLAQLKERGGVADSSGGSEAAALQGELQRSPLQVAADSALQEAQTQVHSLRSQLAHATLLVGERDSEIGRLRERLLQQRRLLDEPLPAPQLRQRLSQQLGDLCAELTAPAAAELGGAGEMAADSSQSAALSEASELGSEKLAGMRAQLGDMRDQLLARDRQLAERDERAEDAEQLRQTLAERERELTAAGRQLAELAGTADRLRAAERRLAGTDQQLAELAELRQTLASRERELTLAEGQLNEITELRAQLESRDQQVAAGAGQRCELLQARQLLAERDQEKAALLRHLDQQRRHHEREARALRDRFELTITAPTWQQYREASARHGREQARLRRRLADTHGAAELLQRRLEQLADFLEMLLGLEERGVLDLSCLTAQHMADLQRSLLQSRELSQSLTQSLLLGADGALDDSSSSLDVSVTEQSSLHVPELEPTRDQSSLHVPAVKESQAPAAVKTRKLDSSLAPTAVDGQRHDSPGVVTPVREQKQSSPTASVAGESLEQAPADATAGAVDRLCSGAEPSEPPPPPTVVAEAGVQVGSPPVTTEQAVQAAEPADQPTEAAVQTTEPTDQTTEAAVQAAEPTEQTTEAAIQTTEPTEQTTEAAIQTTEPTEQTARLETLRAQVESRDAQLLQQTQLVAELRRQLVRLRDARPAADRAQSEPDGSPPPKTEVGGGDELTEEEERAAPTAGPRDALPGDVRDRFRSLVQRQRTSDRASGTDTTPAGTTVERALSPILGLARAQSAELLGLGAGPQVAAKPSRSSGQLMPPPPAPSGGQETHHARRRSHESALPPPPPPPPADWSESEAWSEPDRDVSLARIGLDQSSLGTRTESWLGQHSDSDARRSRRRQRGGAQQAQELDAHIEGLHQVKDALRAEVDIYQKVLPPGRHRPKQSDTQPEPAGVLVPREVLAEIHSLQQQLERAIVANERIRRQLERELSPRPAPHAELARTLQVTQHQLAESTEQLSASQQRCDELRAKLSRAKDNLRLAQLNAEEFKDKFVRVSDDMVRLRDRFNQIETDRDRTSEDSRRRRRPTPDSDAVRRLERQLEAATTALGSQEQLSDQLRQQLLQRPLADATPQPAGLHGSCSDTQLLALNREKLRLMGERVQLASRGRLLRSESCLLDGEARQAAAQRRLEAAKWAGWALEREQLQAEIGRLRGQLAAAEAEAGRRLLAEAERARLAEEHGHCQRRLADLSRTMQTDKHRLAEVSAQLEEVNTEMEAMRLKLNELDDAGQSCADSARSCVLPPAASAEPELEHEPEPIIRRSTSESDGHDVHHESDRTSAYSSPDLGIESDCCRGPHSSSHADTAPPTACSCPAHGTAEPEPATSETELLRQERDMMHSKLATTRAALQQALDKLSRADQRKARVERAIYRQLSKTHDILRRAKNNLAPAGPPGAELAPAQH